MVDDDSDDEGVIEAAAVTVIVAALPADVDVSVTCCQYFCCS